MYEIEFDDKLYWVSRFRLSVDELDMDKSHAQNLQSEFHTMKYIKEHTSIPLPEVYDFNVSSDPESNKVGWPYLMMEALNGRTLIGTFEEVIPLAHQDKVLSQLANYRDQLSSLRFSK